MVDSTKYSVHQSIKWILICGLMWVWTKSQGGKCVMNENINISLNFSLNISDILGAILNLVILPTQHTFKNIQQYAWNLSFYSKFHFTVRHQMKVLPHFFLYDFFPMFLYLATEVYTYEQNHNYSSSYNLSIHQCSQFNQINHRTDANYKPDVSPICDLISLSPLCNSEAQNNVFLCLVCNNIANTQRAELN